MNLTQQQKEVLEAQHKKERDHRIADRIKAVLLRNEGWSQIQIAQALRVRPETVHEHLNVKKSKNLNQRRAVLRAI